MPATMPEWVKPEAEAMICETHGWAPAEYRPTTITRATATNVWIRTGSAKEQRYTLARDGQLEEFGASKYYGTTLVPTTDPHIAAAAAAREVIQARSAARTACRVFDSNPNPHTATQLRDALNAYLTLDPEA